MFAASDDKQVSVYDIQMNRAVGSFEQKGMATSVDASPDGRHFVVGSAEGTVILWDLGMQCIVSSHRYV